MAEHRLDRAEIGAAAQEVGRERVPELVGRELRRDPGHPRVELHELPEALAREALAPRGDEHVGRRLGVRAVRAHVREVPIDRGERDLSHRDEPPFLTFPERRDHTSFEVELAELEVAELAHAEAGGVHELEHRRVADAARRVGPRRDEEAHDVGLGEHAGELPVEPRSRDAPGRVGLLDPFPHEELAEAADRGELTRRRPRREPALAVVDEEPGERLGRDVVGQGARLVLPEGGRELPEIARVGLEGVLGERPLHPEMIQVGVDVAVEVHERSVAGRRLVVRFVTPIR